MTESLLQLAQYNRWTDKEMEILKNWYQQPIKLEKLEELLPNRNNFDCRSKAYKLGIAGKKNHYYIYKINFNLTDTDKAYMAGIFDGEGYLTIANKKAVNNFYWRLGIGMTNEEVLKFFQDKVGGKIYKEKTEIGNKQIYRYQLSNQNRIYFFLKELLPYLIVKKEKVEEFIKYTKIKYKIK